MNKEIEDQIRRKIWDGKVHEFFNEVRELLESEPPLSKEADIDEFLNHVTWLDFTRELQVAIEQVIGNLMMGNTGYSDEYLRGQINAFMILMKMPDFIREQVRQNKEEEEENDS